MHIYIDESGIFRNPANKDNVASCIAALAVPTTKKKELFKQFKALTRNWRDKNGEVKGSKLDEPQIASIIALLRKFDVILELIVIDLGLHTEEEITKFKEIQVSDMIGDIPPDHKPDVLKRATEIQSMFASMSTQLVIQANLMFLVIPRILFHMVLYYARRIPQELQWFYWTVDAKNESKNAYEDAWSTALYPVMAGQGAQNPIPFVEGGDYSYFEQFEQKDTEAVRRIEREKGVERGTLSSIRLGGIFEKHFEFQDSRWNVGLQMADVLANAAQRALNGKLQISGWGEIGRLMIQRSPSPIQFVKFDMNAKKGDTTSMTDSPFYQPLKLMGAKARPIWLDPAGEARLLEQNPVDEDNLMSDEDAARIDLKGLP
jgi:Protein of unknown function (DUF3800)